MVHPLCNYFQQFFFPFNFSIPHQKKKIELQKYINAFLDEKTDASHPPARADKTSGESGHRLTQLWLVLPGLISEQKRT